MLRFTFVRLFICILFHITYLIRSSSEHDEYSLESDLYDIGTSDETFDVSNKGDSDEETVPMSYADDDITEKGKVG